MIFQILFQLFMHITHIPSKKEQQIPQKIGLIA